MADIKFSIIIPVYNNTTTIERCLDSVCKQLYKNFEVILVDDGSDVSYDYLKEKYENLITVRLPENKGQSYARQYAIDNVATGDWIMFVDSDDELINVCTLMTLARTIRKSPDSLVLRSKFAIINNDNIANNKFTITSPYFQPLHGIAFNSNFLKRDNIRFCDKLKIYEDQHFYLQCMYVIQYKYDNKGIVDISSITYNYHMSSTCMSQNLYKYRLGLSDDDNIMHIDMLYDLYDKFSDVLPKKEKEFLVLLILILSVQLYVSMDENMFDRTKKLVLHISDMIDRFSADFNKSDRFRFNDFFKFIDVSDEMKSVIDQIINQTGLTYETFMYMCEDLYIYHTILNKDNSMK